MRLRGGALALSIILASLLAFLGVVQAQQYSPPHDRPGPAVDVIRFRGGIDVDVAPAEIKAGEIDLYLFNLKTEAARQLRREGLVNVVESPATTLSLILNPAPAGEGELNPFSIKEVRQAMQYLVDREYIRNVFFKGFAVPMYTHVSPLDLDYLTIYDLVRKLNFRYDPELAREMITRAMEEAGAELVDGKWRYGGRDVTIKFIIRPEDERRDIGLMVASELERMGFNVVRIILEFGPAIDRVYSTDPKAFEWHIYTEGWGRGAVERYDTVGISQFCAPWFGNMPGWRELGFWQYENAELDEIAQKIFRGEFSGVAERNELYRRATRLCAEDSVRIWLVTVMNSFPASKEMRGLLTDLVSGPRSIYSLREAYLPGKSTLVVGHRWVWTPRTTWNPVGGFGDVYSVDIWKYIVDPLVARHPYSGKPIPFRADFEVEEAGPNGSITVPPDAFVWDAELGAWRNVGPGTTARSKVVFDLSKYLGAKWHHGEEITWADVLYSIYQAFDISYNKEKNRIETAIAVTSRPFLETFKGFRIVGDSMLEVYVDYWHFEEESIAEFAALPSISMPWEVLAAMDELVFEKRRAAYSDTAAFRFNLNWLNLVSERDGLQLRQVLLEFLDEGFVPLNVFTVDGKRYVTLEEAESRYRAAIKWFDEKRHMVISQGPFALERFDAPAQFVEVVAFRDPSYPFKPGDWALRFGEVDLIEFVSVKAEPLMIGSDNAIGVRLKGPGDLGLRYLLLDPATGEVIDAGEAERVGPGSFEVKIPAEKTGRLRQGIYQLFLAAYSSESLGMVFERRLDLEATKTPPPERAATVEEVEPEGVVEEAEVEEAAGPGIGMVVIAAVVAVVAIAAAMIAVKRRGFRA